MSIDNSIVIVDECVSGDTQIFVKPDCEVSNYRNSKSVIKQIVKNFESGKEIYVLSHNDKSGKLEYKKVLNAKATGSKKLLGITVQQRSVPIKCSYEHPFAIYQDGKVNYIPAIDLKIGDRLLLIKDGDNNHSIYSNNNYDILLGFLLGDGSLSKNKQVTPDIYRIKKQHGMCQLEYCKFSAKILNTTVIFSGKSGYTGETQPICQTKSLYIDPKFINSIYKKDLKKNICEEVEQYFTERTLAL